MSFTNGDDVALDREIEQLNTTVTMHQLPLVSGNMRAGVVNDMLVIAVPIDTAMINGAPLTQRGGRHVATTISGRRNYCPTVYFNGEGQGVVFSLSVVTADQPSTRKPATATGRDACGNQYLLNKRHDQNC